MASAAGAANATKTVTDKISKAFPNIKIDGIQKSSISGLYEIRVGKNVFYSDLSGEHVILGGQIIETSTQRNLTRERMRELSLIDWNTLPLEKAIVSGPKNAKLKMAVFTDPQCTFCDRLEQELQQAPDIRVYTFLYPLEMHKDARRICEAIWCSEDRRAAFLKVFLEGGDVHAEKCETPIDDIIELGHKLGITGTPTIISEDGRMSAGWKTADDLRKWLSNK
jgi:thiol:disulfide interchange protein DsbC